MLRGKASMTLFQKRAGIIRVVSLFCAALGLGYALGRARSVPPLARVGKNEASAVSTKEVSSSQAQFVSQIEEPPIPSIDPSDIPHLHGKPFLAALPAIAAQAREGNIEATRLLYQRLGSCRDYKPKSDEKITADAERDYLQSLKWRERFKDQDPNTPFMQALRANTAPDAKEHAIQAAKDQRDLCAALTPEQARRYLEWIELAVRQRDRKTILDATTSEFSFHGIERVRYAERLADLAEDAKSALGGLVSRGDVEALFRGASAFSGGWSLFPYDGEQAYTYAYALSLIRNTENNYASSAAQIMENLSTGQSYPALTPKQIAAAKENGLALFRQCCAKAADQ